MDATDLPAQLAALAELHRTGALDDDEFRAAKGRLLNGRPPATPPAADTGSGDAPPGETGVGRADAPETPTTGPDGRPRLGPGVNGVDRAPDGADPPRHGTSGHRVYRALHRSARPVPRDALVAESGIDEAGVAGALAELTIKRIVDRDEDFNYWAVPGAPDPAPAPVRTRRGPSVGGWGWAIVLLGFVGGLIGYFSLKSTDPVRANHVMMWSLIFTVVWLVGPRLLAALVLSLQ